MSWSGIIDQHTHRISEDILPDSVPLTTNTFLRLLPEQDNPPIQWNETLNTHILPLPNTLGAGYSDGTILTIVNDEATVQPTIDNFQYPTFSPSDPAAQYCIQASSGPAFDAANFGWFQLPGNATPNGSDLSLMQQGSTYNLFRLGYFTLGGQSTGAYILTYAVVGTDLYVGGRFDGFSPQSAPAIAAKNIMRIDCAADPITFHVVGDGAGGGVRGLNDVVRVIRACPTANPVGPGAQYAGSNLSIIIGGDFSTEEAGAAAAMPYVCLYNKTTDLFSRIGTQAASGVDGPVDDISYDFGEFNRCIIAGNFANAQGDAGAATPMTNYLCSYMYNFNGAANTVAAIGSAGQIIAHSGFHGCRCLNQWCYLSCPFADIAPANQATEMKNVGCIWFNIADPLPGQDVINAVTAATLSANIMRKVPWLIPGTNPGDRAVCVAPVNLLTSANVVVLTNDNQTPYSVISLIDPSVLYDAAATPAQPWYYYQYGTTTGWTPGPAAYHVLKSLIGASQTAIVYSTLAAGQPTQVGNELAANGLQNLQVGFTPGVGNGVVTISPQGVESTAHYLNFAQRYVSTQLAIDKVNNQYLTIGVYGGITYA